MPFFATDCARARESVSVQLDGELPELELVRLEAHLRICADCSAWSEDVEETTRRLRKSFLEVPVPSFAVAQRGRRLVGTRSPAVAATLAAASLAALLVFHPARLAPSVSSRHSALGRGTARLLPQDRLERLDGGFAFGVRTLPQRGGNTPS